MKKYVIVHDYSAVYMFDIKSIESATNCIIRDITNKNKNKIYNFCKIKFGSFFKVICATQNFRKRMAESPEEYEVVETGGIKQFGEMLIALPAYKNEEDRDKQLSKCSFIVEFESDADAELFCEMKKQEYADTYDINCWEEEENEQN